MLRPGTFALTALLAALSAIGPLTTDMYLPSLPDIARQLNASTAQVQFTISAYLIGFAVGQIFYGPVSDRHGRKPVLMAAIALYCVASLACALSTSIEMLIVARAYSGAWRLRRNRADARHRARHLFRRARRTRIVDDRRGDGARTGAGADCRRRAADRLRLALGVLHAGRAGIAGVAIVWTVLPETLKMRAAEPVSASSMLRSYRIVARNPAYLAYLGITSASYAGLFAWISGSAFVLQDLYGLAPFDFGVAFALGSIGYMTGSALAARMVVRLGLDGVLGIGGCACAAGGLGMVAAVALGLTSSLSLVLPIAVYLAGLGMVLPQGIAGALTPFPERAGAASSLFGFVQQSIAAVCGAVVGLSLGRSAWPLAAAVATMGCATLLLWLATRRVRRAGAKH